mgnify:CR=1 FL=1
MNEPIEKSNYQHDNRDKHNSSYLIQNLLRTGTYLQREGNRIVGEFAIKQQQFTVLNEIVRKGRVYQKQLIGELLFEKSNISKIVQVLIKKELIQTEHSQKDRRIIILSYTAKGLKVWQQCMDRFNKWSISFTSTLTQNEARQLLQLLEKLPVTATQ